MFNTCISSLLYPKSTTFAQLGEQEVLSLSLCLRPVDERSGDVADDPLVTGHLFQCIYFPNYIRTGFLIGTDQSLQGILSTRLSVLCHIDVRVSAYNNEEEEE